MRAILLVLVFAGPALGQGFGGAEAGSFSQTVPDVTPKNRYPSPKPAPKLSFDPTAKVKAWLAAKDSRVVAGGKETRLDVKALAIGKPISLEGCYWDGLGQQANRVMFYWTKHEGLLAINTAEVD